MASNDLLLRLQMELNDKVSAPLKSVTQSSQLSAKALKANRDRLKELARDNSLIQKLKKEQESFKRNTVELKSNQANLNALKISGSASAAQIKAHTSLVDKSTQALNKQKIRIFELRSQANNSGIKNLAADEKRLANEIKNTTQMIGRQEAALRRMEQLRSQRNQSLGNAAAIAGTGMGMRMAGEKGLRASFGLMRFGIDFDSTMSRVQALARLDANSGQLAALRQQADELGASTMFSATEAAQGQAFLAMAGFKPDAIMAAMPGLLDMALAGDIDLGTTADIASNISSGFGIDPAEMMRVADVLTMAFTSSNVSLEMLGDTMKYVAPNARALGISMEETAALAGLLGNVGIQGSQAGTAMRGMFTRMATQPAAARNALAELQIEFADMQGNMRPLPEILLDFKRATEGMGNLEQLRYVSEVFGREPSSAVMELLNQSEGNMQSFIEQMRNSAGAASQTARTMTDNIVGDWDELTSATEGVGISFFDLIKDDLRSLLRFFADIVNGIRAWVKENPQLAATLTKITLGVLALMTAIGSVMIAIAGILAPTVILKYTLGMLGIKFNGLIPIIFNVGKALFKLGLGLLTNPLFLTIAALVAAIAFAAWAIYKNWDTIVWFFQDIWDQLKTAFDGGIGGISAFILNWSPLGLFYKVFAVVMDYFGITLPENFTTFAGNILGAFGGIIVGAAGSIKDFFVTAFNDVLNWFTVELPEKFMGFGTMIMDGLKNGITGAIGGVKDAIVGVADGAIGWFQNILDMHSPSRVFMAAGMNISEGAALGITKGQPLVERASIALADTSTDAFIIDRRSPVRAGAANGAGQAGITRDNITIHIHAAAGDPQEIARAVEEALNRREREKRARNNSGYFDA